MVPDFKPGFEATSGTLSRCLYFLDAVLCGQVGNGVFQSCYKRGGWLWLISKLSRQQSKKQ